MKQFTLVIDGYLQQSLDADRCGVEGPDLVFYDGKGGVVASMERHRVTDLFSIAAVSSIPEPPMVE